MCLNILKGKNDGEMTVVLLLMEPVLKWSLVLNAYPSNAQFWIGIAMRLQTVVFPFFALIIFTSASFGNDYVINPNGTGDFPTIQAAIDAAINGDEILLTNGVFKGAGNRDIDFKGKAITVRSQKGSPQDCIIDPEGVQWIPQRGFIFKTNEGHNSIVRDITITHGSTDDC